MDVLSPVDEAVGHHVQGHLHLALAQGIGLRVRDERLERAEGEAVEKHPHRRSAGGLLHRLDHLGALLRIGGIDVEKPGLAAQRLDLGDDLLDVLQPGPPVQVNAEDVVPGLGQRQGRRLAKPARRSQDQRPATRCIGHRRVSSLLSFQCNASSIQMRMGIVPRQDRPTDPITPTGSRTAPISRLATFLAETRPRAPINLDHPLDHPYHPSFPSSPSRGGRDPPYPPTASRTSP